MGRVLERDNYHLARKLDRQSPGLQKWSERQASKQVQVPVDDKLTAEQAFAANQKDPSVVGPLFKLGRCEDCLDAGKLSESERLRYWGLMRIHKMAALTLYNNRCDKRPSDDKAAAAAIIESQFRTLPREVQEKALDREVKAIESRKDYYEKGALVVPGGWRWFCNIMNDQINRGEADPIFTTAREGFFPVEEH
jgi:hypothetical protein